MHLIFLKAHYFLPLSLILINAMDTMSHSDFTIYKNLVWILIYVSKGISFLNMSLWLDVKCYYRVSAVL